jgi:hypothetical protein
MSCWSCCISKQNLDLCGWYSIQFCPKFVTGIWTEYMTFLFGHRLTAGMTTERSSTNLGKLSEWRFLSQYFWPALTFLSRGPQTHPMLPCSYSHYTVIFVILQNWCLVCYLWTCDFDYLIVHTTKYVYRSAAEQQSKCVRHRCYLVLNWFEFHQWQQWFGNIYSLATNDLPFTVFTLWFIYLAVKYSSLSWNFSFCYTDALQLSISCSLKVSALCTWSSFYVLSYMCRLGCSVRWEY